MRSTTPDWKTHTVKLFDGVNDYPVSNYTEAFPKQCNANDVFTVPSTPIVIKKKFSELPVMFKQSELLTNPNWNDSYNMV